jgi:hypothetical protein
MNRFHARPIMAPQTTPDRIWELHEFFKKLMIGIGLIFLPFSWSEVRFSLLGTTARATVTQINESAVRGATKKVLSIEYRFADPSGRERTEEDRLPFGDPRPSVGNQIDIQYCAGLPGQSRVIGNSQIVLVYFFLALVAAICITQLALPPDEFDQRAFAAPRWAI